MDYLSLIGIGSYLLIVCVAWIVISCFFHDEKKELNKSWTMSIILGLFSAVFWPVSLWAICAYYKRNEYEKKLEDEASKC